MAIRNDRAGGTDFVEEGLKPSDNNDTFNAAVQAFYYDDSPTPVTNTATETDILTITIPQDDLNDNATLDISTTLSFEDVAAPNTDPLFRLYVGGVVKQSAGFTGDTGSTPNESYLSMHHIETGVDSTAGAVIVKVTGQLTAGANVDIMSGISLVVRGVNR